MTIGHVDDPGYPVLTDRWTWLPFDHQRECERRGGCYLVTIGHISDPGCPVLTDSGYLVIVRVFEEGYLVTIGHVGDPGCPVLTA